MDVFQEILIVLLRALASVIVLFLISRLEGARQISQLTFYDYIVGISIGSIAAMAVEEKIPLYDMFISMIVFGGFSFFLAWLTNKSIVGRRLLSGKPCLLIYNGKIMENGLKKNHLDVNDLLLNCRLQGYFKLEDVAYAILETNGQVSVLPKSDKAPITPYDMSMKPQQSALEYNLILDGKILYKNLKCYGKDETWLKTQLSQQKINSESEVLLATGDSNNNLKVYLKNEMPPHNDFFI